MTILMFGWEFPPHISGGLGTACYGLTEALLEAKTKLIFVLPRLHGKEKGDFLIDASTFTPHPAHPIPNQSQGTTATHSYRVVYRHNMTVLEVPSTLRPYERSTPPMTPISSTASETPAHLRHTEGATMEEILTAPKTVTFTGIYGDDLFNEVERYAEVAGLIASKHAFDLIHVHDWMTFPAGIAAKRMSRKPLIAHVHSTEFDRAGDKADAVIVGIEKFGLRQADSIIAVSNWTKQILISKYEIPEEKITVIYNGVRPRKQVQRFNFPELGSHIVTFLGRITRQKGPRYFVEAAERVLHEFPDAHFIIAGAGDLLPQTIERVAQLNMSSRFHFTGFLSHEQVDQIWSMTDVYVMPSVSEPFGIAPLEAIQGGVPVILSRQSGVSEVMPHAIKVDFWNVKAVAAAICSILRYESLSNVLRQKGRQQIKNLTWTKAAEDVKLLYDELAGQK